MHYPLSRPATLFAASAWIATSYAQNTASVTPVAKAAQASGVSQQINPSFAGVGIEPSNLFSFTGAATPNQLSINLLQNLADYAGAPAHIRMGGNTADYMIYNQTFQGYRLLNNPDAASSESANYLIFGPNYLEALDRFPTDTPITYGLNFGYQGADYADAIATAAAGVLDELNNTKVYSFEIGNEPDLYGSNGNTLRTAAMSGTTYTQQYLDRAGIVYRQVLQPRGIDPTFFEASQTASTIGTSFTIDDLNNGGLTAEVNGSKFVSSWNQHDYFYFVGVSTYTLTLNYMLNLDNTESQFKYWTTEVSSALKTGLPYNLREMASVGPTGLQGISDTFGASLWTLNFFCYAATLNISSVQMHMTDNSYGSPWAPVTLNKQGPHVRPSYYAFAAFAQLLGSSNGTTQMAVLSPATTSSFIRSYAAYEAGALTSLVLINSNQVNASSTTKANITFSVSLPDYSGKVLYLSYLTADGADSTSNITWNGISFEQDSVGTPSGGDDSAQSVKIGSDGIATFNVRDSQAVIARLDSAVGSTNATDAAATSASSATSSATATTTKASSDATKLVAKSLMMVLLALVPAFM